MTLFDIALSLAGLSFLIFVHELGHFLAAKKVGIRVEAFCIGFQPTIFGFRARFFAFRRGDTEYALGMVPFGGYVRMAGEEAGDEKTGSDDEFSSKSIGERAFVLVAGSAMNLIFGFLFFIVAFTMGFETPSAVVGAVVPHQPAWEAGLRPGDHIVGIDGSPKKEYMEVATIIALNGTESSLTLDVERDGKPLQKSMTPKKDPVRGMPFVGFRPSVRLRIGVVNEGSAADRAGVRVGDNIRSIELRTGENSLRIPSNLHANQQWEMLSTFALSHQTGQVALELERDGATVNAVVELEASEQPTEGAPVLGFTRARRMIEAVLPGSPAADVLRAGWEIVELQGQRVRQVDAWTVAQLAANAAEVHFTTATGEQGTVATESLIAWLANDVRLTTESNEIDSILENGVAAKLGLEQGDRILSIGGFPVSGATSLKRLDFEGKDTEIVTWSASKGVSTHPWKSVDGTPDLGVKFVDEVYVGTVNEGSAADEAGLKPGDHLLEINGAEVLSWSDVTSNVRTITPAPFWRVWKRSADFEGKQLNVKVSRAGTPVTIECTSRPYAGGKLGLAVSEDTVLLKTSIAGACVEGPRRCWLWSVRIPLTFLALLSGDVSPKNLAGPVGIIQVGGAASTRGIGMLIFILAVISVNLGIFNLMPFPILDGGHILFLVIEKIKGSPVSDRIQQWAFLVAFIMLIGLAIFVTYHDIMRLL